MSTKDARHDPHRPSVMDPSEYVYVGCADDHTPEDSFYELREDVLTRYGASAHPVPWYDATQDGRPNYRCHHCGKHGSNIRYFVFFLHKPTLQVITVGQICAKKLNLGTREELDFQKRNEAYKRLRARAEWRDAHRAEYDFLREYDEKHAEGGPYNEFFESLWNSLQKYGTLTFRQLEVLRDRMAKWQQLDADRHQGRVTHTDQAPTEAQLRYIASLAEALDSPYDAPQTRQEASDLINTMKAAKSMSEDRTEPQERSEQPMTDKQRAFINTLMEERSMPLEQRREARAQLDAGLTKTVASRWIEKLQSLPRIDASL